MVENLRNLDILQRQLGIHPQNVGQRKQEWLNFLAQGVLTTTLVKITVRDANE